jgi:hypothetical protein
MSVASNVTHFDECPCTNELQYMRCMDVRGVHIFDQRLKTGGVTCASQSPDLSHGGKMPQRDPHRYGSVDVAAPATLPRIITLCFFLHKLVGSLCERK